MTKQECASLLQSPYKRESALRLMGEVFGEAFTPLSKAAEGKRTGIGTARALGRVELNEDSFEVLEIETDPKIRIAHNRVSLNRGTKDYFNGLDVRGVLAFFHSPSDTAWRFTYAAKSFGFDSANKTVRRQTDARRFTYVLGPEASTLTPAMRLLALRDSPYPTYAMLSEAFSVEAVSKEFFSKYRDFYVRFTAELSKAKKARSLFKVPVHNDPKAQAAADKPFRDFSKKLLGRLVFLKFLEKKGWLGAKDYAAADGDKEFLKRLFDSHPERFYSDALVPLFFETMNTKRKDDLFRLTGTKVPFLNGGLFENDYPMDVNLSLSFPGSLFRELLEFLGSYNFTIDENDEGDADIGVDPEMLGRIFEQLIEDNEKDMNGTIYTPFEVVRFMCRESLVLHLCRVLGIERESEKAQAVKALIVRNEAEGLSPEDKKKIAASLREIKILDPAVGSGAFPMGMMREILDARLLLEPGAASDPSARERFKREIIKNSIYGVDLDHGAVDIARLRFFLSLVVDCLEPEPLPNLDYKLMQGDSLAEEYEGVDLCMKSSDVMDGKRKGQMGFDFSGKALTRDKLLTAITDFYEATEHEKKRELEEGIRSTVASFIATKLADEGKDIDQEALTELLRRNAPFFLWHLYFKDAFDSGGFDIIIGNPPYRVGQENAGDHAQTRSYPVIDARIKETFVAQGTATLKRQLYDLYVRFFRLVMDFSKNGSKKSIISFITNYSYIDGRTFDGFRKVVASEFNRISIVNLGGDVRANPKLSGPINSIFGIQAGVAISMFEKQGTIDRTQILYSETEEEATREEKMEFIQSYNDFDLPYKKMVPVDDSIWIEKRANNSSGFISLYNKETKKGNSGSIFSSFSGGVKTSRDEWVYDFEENTLVKKVKYFINIFNESIGKKNLRQFANIKWTRGLENLHSSKTELGYTKDEIQFSLYRPFIAKLLYFDKRLIEMILLVHKYFPKNKCIMLPGMYGDKPFSSLAVGLIPCYDLLEKTQCLPLYRYDSGKRLDNITDWSLSEFHRHYSSPSVSSESSVVQSSPLPITKEDIFHYVYAVLHNPVYRKKYEIDLKQDYPRIPFYKDFWKWSGWGKTLMDMHIGFETVEPAKGIKTTKAPEGARETKTHRLDYVKDEKGDRIFSGSLTFCDGSGLSGIPPRAFEYRLGNKSAIEWVLDQYVAPSYPTDEEVASGKRKIREDEKVLRDKFNTFKFEDYKEKVIDLIKRLVTLSLATLDIQEEMGREEGE